MAERLSSNLTPVLLSRRSVKKSKWTTMTKAPVNLKDAKGEDVRELEEMGSDDLVSGTKKQKKGDSEVAQVAKDAQATSPSKVKVVQEEEDDPMKEVPAKGDTVCRGDNPR